MSGGVADVASLPSCVPVRSASDAAGSTARRQELGVRGCEGLRVAETRSRSPYLQPSLVAALHCFGKARQG